MHGAVPQITIYKMEEYGSGHARIITERFSEVNCFRRIGESDREAHALNRIFWPICRFFVRKLQVGDKVKWQ